MLGLRFKFESVLFGQVWVVLEAAGVPVINELFDALHDARMLLVKQSKEGLHLQRSQVLLLPLHRFADVRDKRDYAIIQAT